MRKMKLRRYLATGLLVWIPLGVTLLLLRVLINLMDGLIPTLLRPENLFGFRIPGLGVILTLTLLLTTGFFAANLLGKKLIAVWEALLARIPLVSWVYSGVKKVAETLLSPRSQSFRKVLLIEYPRKGVWSLCFQTSSDLGEVHAHNRTGSRLRFRPDDAKPDFGLHYSGTQR